MSSDKPSRYTEKMNISRYEYVKKLAKDRNIIYKHLTETLGPEQAQQIFKEAYTKKNAEQAKQIAEEANIQSFEDYKQYIKSNQDRLGERWLRQTIVEDTDDKLVYRVYRCLIADTHRELGLTEQGYATSCFGDYAFFEAHPCARFKRGRSLMQGAEYCDMIFTWEEDKD